MRRHQDEETAVRREQLIAAAETGQSCVGGVSEEKRV